MTEQANSEPKLRVKLTDEQKEDLCNRYRDGVPTSELVTEFEISVPTLNKILDLNSVPRRKKGRRKGSFAVQFTPEQQQKVVKIYEGGASLPETAKEMSSDEQKVSVPAIRDILVKNGIQIRSPGRVSKTSTSSEE